MSAGSATASLPEVRYIPRPSRPGQITGIIVNKVNVWAILFIEQTGPDAPVTVNLNDGADSAPNRSTSAATAHNLETIQGPSPWKAARSSDRLAMFDEKWPSQPGLHHYGHLRDAAEHGPITFTGLAGSNVYLFAPPPNVYKINET